MSDSVFDIALERRFVESDEIAIIDVTSSDMLLIRDTATGVVMRLSFSTLADAISSAFGSSFASLVDGKVPASQLPSFVDDVLEYANLAAFPATGESGKIYVAIDTNITYRWSGSSYVEISSSLALGETSSTAYRGDRGKTAYDHSQATTGNPHGTTKADLGLGNVDNTSDANKPVSTAQAASIATKLNNSGSNTHNGQLKVQGLTNASGVLAIQPGPTGGGRQYNLESIGGSIFRLYDASAGAERWRVDANGHFLPGADNTYELGGVNRWKKIYAMKLRLDSNTAVAPTGGSAAALPALPVGYFEVDILGTNYKVPYYG